MRLEAQLKQITQTEESKISKQKKDRIFKDKHKKPAESKEKKMAKNPSHTELNSLLAHYQSRRYDDAEKLAVSITEQFPHHQYSWKVLGAVLKQTGRISESLDASQKAVELDSQDTEAHYNLGNTLKKLGRYTEAEASYRQAIALTPGYVEAHSNLGNTLKELGRLEEAEASCRQVIELKPDFAEAHSNLGVTLKELGRLEEAEASYRQAIALKPDYVEAQNNLGNTLKELGRLEEAEAICRQAIGLKPSFAEAHSNLGVTLQKLGRLEEAEASCRQAIALKPGFAEAQSNLGNTLKDLGRYAEAVACFEKAIALKSDFPEVRYNLGIILFESAEYQKAAEQFKLTDIHHSKSYAIRCSYLQDEKTTFYDQLDSLISQGEINAVIGSLSCRSEIRYGINKPNPFCNDPLKYVLETDLNGQCDFENIFTKAARDILTDDTVSYKSQGHLTNGSQTAGNLFALEEKFINEIENIIHAEIEKYRVHFKDSEEGFIKSWPTSYSIYGWLVSMQSGGELAAHMHDAGWITGSIYINVPPKSKADSGNLVVCLDDQECEGGVKKNQKSTIDVVTGSLCLFPSSLLHYTIPFEAEEDRIVLAFDVIPK